MTTYSVGTVNHRTIGDKAGQPVQVTLPDGTATMGNSTTTLSLNQHGPAAVGGMQQAMMLGTQVLCKDADGQLRYYTIDAENSDLTKGIVKMRRA